MKKVNTSFGKFAELWDKEVGDRGNFTHSQMINKPLLNLLGDIKGKRVYDVACGNGVLSRALVKKGAVEVWASDISPELITVAKENYKSENIRYSVRDAVDFRGVPKNHFNTVVLLLAAYYIKDIGLFFKKSHDVLKDNGSIVFVLPHPLFNVAEELENPKQKAVKLDMDYLKDKKVAWHKNGNKKYGKNVYYSRPLQSYINALAVAGFKITNFIEPAGAIRVKNKIKKINIPKYIIIKAVKV